MSLADRRTRAAVAIARRAAASAVKPFGWGLSTSSALAAAGGRSGTCCAVACDEAQANTTHTNARAWRTPIDHATPGIAAAKNRRVSVQNLY